MSWQTDAEKKLAEGWECAEQVDIFEAIAEAEGMLAPVATKTRTSVESRDSLPSGR